MKYIWRQIVLFFRWFGKNSLLERQIRRSYTIQFSYVPQDGQVVRHRWQDEVLQEEVDTVEEALQRFDLWSHKPMARSSQTVEEAFNRANIIFADESRFEVFVAGGETLWLKPLLGLDSVLVFEKMPAISTDIVLGDVVVFSAQDGLVIHVVKKLNEAKDGFCAGDGVFIPFSTVKKRLVAIFYTRAGVEGKMPAFSHHHQFNIDIWDDEFFTPLSRADKPSPHSSLLMGGSEVKRARRIFGNQGGLSGNIQNTNSMEPFIDKDAVVAFEQLNETIHKQYPLQVGDVVSWYDKSRQLNILHRIIGLGKNKHYFLKGDNTISPDFTNKQFGIPQKLIQLRVVALFFTRCQRKDD